MKQIKIDINKFEVNIECVGTLYVVVRLHRRASITKSKFGDYGANFSIMQHFNTIVEANDFIDKIGYTKPIKYTYRKLGQ